MFLLQSIFSIKKSVNWPLNIHLFSCRVFMHINICICICKFKPCVSIYACMFASGHCHDPLPDFSADLSASVQLIFQDIGRVDILHGGHSDDFHWNLKFINTICMNMQVLRATKYSLHPWCRYIYPCFPISASQCGRCRKRWICELAFLPVAGLWSARFNYAWNLCHRNLIADRDN